MSKRPPEPPRNRKRPVDLSDLRHIVREVERAAYPWESDMRPNKRIKPVRVDYVRNGKVQYSKNSTSVAKFLSILENLEMEGYGRRESIRMLIRARPEMVADVMDTIGSHPSSEPALRELQKLY